MPGYKVQRFNKDSNDKKLEEHLDLLGERREKVEVKMVANKNKAEHYFNRRIKPISFKVGPKGSRNDDTRRR